LSLTGAYNYYAGVGPYDNEGTGQLNFGAQLSF
jgi:hypothetical protein